MAGALGKKAPAWLCGGRSGFFKILLPNFKLPIFNLKFARVHSFSMAPNVAFTHGLFCDTRLVLLGVLRRVLLAPLLGSVYFLNSCRSLSR